MKIVTKIFFLLFLIAFLSNSLFAKDEITKKVIELPDFTSIYLNSGYSIYLKQTNKQEVEVEVLTEIFEQTEISVKDGVLHVNIKKDESSGSKSFWAKMDKIKINPTMKIHISMRRVNELMVNGGGKIISQNSINSNNLSLAVNGPGGMDLDIKGNIIRTTITGSGDVSLKGYADSNQIVMGGSGNLHAFKLEVLKANIKLSGSGSCEVNVTDKMEAVIYGGGTISHKGDTKNLVKKIYGSGKVLRSY